MFAPVRCLRGLLGLFVVFVVISISGLAQVTTPDVAPSDEEKAWANVNALKAASLTAFLKDFPQGAHRREAEGYLIFIKKLADIARGRLHSRDVITNAQLGKAWSAWKRDNPHKAASTGGIFVEQTEKDTSIGIFRVIGGDATPNEMYMQPVNTFMGCAEKVYLGHIPGHAFSLPGPWWPTGEGSIVGIKTGGVKAPYFGLTFETNDDDTLVFGVVGAIGLVHLGGAGKVTLVGGKFLMFK